MFILDWLRTGVSWILVQWHQLLSALGMDPESGWTWVLSIIGLVIVIRIILIPLFVKQIKAQRNMQLIQPQIKEIQKSPYFASPMRLGQQGQAGSGRAGPSQAGPKFSAGPTTELHRSKTAHNM